MRMKYKAIYNVHNILSAIIFNNRLIRSENTYLTKADLSGNNLIQFTWWHY